MFSTDHICGPVTQARVQSEVLMHCLTQQQQDKKGGFE